MRKLMIKLGCVAGCTLMSAASAAPISWVDWTGSVVDASGVTVSGTITIGAETIDVTYFNPVGISFLNDGVGFETDYWQNARSGRDASSSAFTSTGPKGVDNIPTGTDLIAMRFAGESTLTFSQEITDLYFSYVSTNGNRYDFDSDFSILSNTGSNIDGNGVDDAGYWGSGTVAREEDADGSFNLRTLTGEPHGTILFESVMTTLIWDSLISENWNGFTIGLSANSIVASDPVPLPAAVWLFAPALGLFGLRRRRKA